MTPPIARSTDLCCYKMRHGNQPVSNTKLRQSIFQAPGSCWLEMLWSSSCNNSSTNLLQTISKNNHNYTDGGVGFNNPVELLYDEAFAHLSSDLNKNSSAVSECPIAYIVSIGTGEMPDLPQTNLTSFLLSVLKWNLHIVEQASDSENAHHRNGRYLSTIEDSLLSI